MTAPAWPAPHPDSPVDATVALPSSKSLTNRALVLAALADGTSTVTRPLVSRDTELMRAALESLGATITVDGDRWTVSPLGGDVADGTIDCGLAGTVMRFVPPVAALVDARTTFDGDERARVRPMSTTIESLRLLGVEVDDDGTGTLPFTVQGAGRLDGGVLEVDAAASSQFVSALLLVAPRLTEGLDLRHTGDRVPSQPHVDMTITELRRRGVQVDTDGARWVVAPGPIDALDVAIEPDLSNAGPFIAAALVTGGTVRVQHWPETTDQAGDAWRELAVAFGGTVERDGDDVVFTGGDTITAADLDLGDVGELTPVVAAVAALADGPSRLTGVAHLRGHETDRLAALATEISRLGGDVTELDDGLEIRPRPLTGASVATYHDHRMAHFGVVLGLAVPDLVVEDVDTTAKTFPGFADAWSGAVGA